MPIATTQPVKFLLWPSRADHFATDIGATNNYQMLTLSRPNLVPELVAFYTFKAEDILADRVPTLRRVVITYVDYGPFTATLTITGINDDNVVVTTGAKTFTGGTGTFGTLALMTVFVDISITAFRPQLTINVAATKGPLAISTVLMTGTVENMVTL